MAKENADRRNENEAEREAEIEEELERIGRDADEVDAGDDDLGTQNAPRAEADDLEDLEEDAAVEAEDESEES